MLTGRAGSRRATDPAYTPDIGHLVHRNEARQKSARARLAEVLNLTRTATKLRQAAHRKAGERGGSERHHHFPASSTRILGAGGGGGASRLHRQESDDRSSPLPSLHLSIDRGITGTAASRLRSEKSLDKSRDSPLPTLSKSLDHPEHKGGGVSVVHLRSSSEPWRQGPSRALSLGGSADCSRELSPVRDKGAKLKETALTKDSAKQSKDSTEAKERWCDREVDGVYLGRSGWVQVQGGGGPAGGQQQQMPQLRRPSPVQFHSARSEPGPPGSPQRPGYLPLPSSSLDLGGSRLHPASVGTPPQTPIISPPPAFQDMKRSPRRTGLARSDAIAHESPPGSPPHHPTGRRTSSTFRPPPPTRAMTVDESRRHFRESTSSCSSFEQAWFPSTAAGHGAHAGRSLDSSQIGRHMPRLSETDSSMGYDESDYSTLTLINSPHMPQPQISLVERVSPSRGRQRMRRSPGSEKNGGGGSGSSSSSSSPSQHWRRVPVASTQQAPTNIQLGRAYADAGRSYADNTRAYTENNRSYSTDLGRGGSLWPEPSRVAAYGLEQQQTRGGSAPSGYESRLQAAQAAAEKASRVRRSRSLQLPERRSPNPPNPSPQPPEYVEASRLMNGTRRPPMYNRNAQSEELRREAEEEARVVTEFLQSARSREAARNLLRSRLGATSDMSPSGGPPHPMDPYMVIGGRRGRLQRAMTSAGSHPGQPCNPSSCDFWPHCAHRDGIPYSSGRASTPQGSASGQHLPPTMRLSHSYPNQGKKETTTKYGYSSRSSPASLERVDVSPRPRRGMSLNIPEPRYRRSPERWELEPSQQPHIPYKRESLPSVIHHGSDDWSRTGQSGRWDRPGSAPGAHIQPSARSSLPPEATQRSLSLPKCFQAGRELPRPPRLGYQQLLPEERGGERPRAPQAAAAPPSQPQSQPQLLPGGRAAGAYLRREATITDPSTFYYYHNYPTASRDHRRPPLQHQASSSYPPEPSQRYHLSSAAFRQVHSFQEIPTYLQHQEQSYFPSASPNYLPIPGRGLRRKMFTMNI